VSVHFRQSEPIVITGIGMIASVGNDRESVWQAVRAGKSGVRVLEGLSGIPDGLFLGAPVDIDPPQPRQMKATTLALKAAEEAIADAAIDFAAVDRDRFACAVSAHMCDTGPLEDPHGLYDMSAPGSIPWWAQMLPNTTCSTVANRFELWGPRICHSTACASGLIDMLSAMRAIEDNQCDIALVGAADAIHPLFAAGFRQMKVLAHHDVPAEACRPFDAQRSGFVMGEGGAMFVVERLSHAVKRGARIYAELLGGTMLAEAHHVTGLDKESAGLARAITMTLEKVGLAPSDIDYINVHGTGTQQNDLAEARGIQRAFGPAASQTMVSATKSMLGHLVNASGVVELAITVLALRDGFAPPTRNLTHQDPQCELDCIPQVGRAGDLKCALKLSVAFGGHLVALAIRRWDDVRTAVNVPVRPAA
jgi:3-oxoacyl-(acyl-carrier-protein) synthase